MVNEPSSALAIFCTTGFISCYPREYQQIIKYGIMEYGPRFFPIPGPQRSVQLTGISIGCRSRSEL